MDTKKISPNQKAADVTASIAARQLGNQVKDTQSLTDVGDEVNTKDIADIAASLQDDDRQGEKIFTIFTNCENSQVASNSTNSANNNSSTGTPQQNAPFLGETRIVKAEDILPPTKPESQEKSQKNDEKKQVGEPTESDYAANPLLTFAQSEEATIRQANRIAGYGWLQKLHGENYSNDIPSPFAQKDEKGNELTEGYIQLGEKDGARWSWILPKHLEHIKDSPAVILSCTYLDHKHRTRDGKDDPTFWEQSVSMFFEMYRDWQHAWPNDDKLKEFRTKWTDADAEVLDAIESSGGHVLSNSDRIANFKYWESIFESARQAVSIPEHGYFADKALGWLYGQNLASVRYAQIDGRKFSYHLADGQLHRFIIAQIVTANNEVVGFQVIAHDKEDIAKLKGKGIDNKQTPCHPDHTLTGCLIPITPLPATSELLENDVFVIAEGIATDGSGYQAIEEKEDFRQMFTKAAVGTEMSWGSVFHYATCLNCGNMKAAIAELRRRYGWRFRIIILADEDNAKEPRKFADNTEKPAPNDGRIHAEACRDLDVMVIYPEFEKYGYSIEYRRKHGYIKDFNDFHHAIGIDKLRQSMLESIAIEKQNHDQAIAQKALEEAEKQRLADEQKRHEQEQQSLHERQAAYENLAQEMNQFFAKLPVESITPPTPVNPIQGIESGHKTRGRNLSRLEYMAREHLQGNIHSIRFARTRYLPAQVYIPLAWMLQLDGKVGVLLDSPIGTGKTDVLARFVEQLREQNPNASVLYLGPSINLTRQAADRLGLEFYQDSMTLNGVHSSRSVACTLDSVYKLQDMKFDVVIIDEAEEHFANLVNKSFTVGRPTVMDALKKILSNTKMLICSQSGLGMLTIEAMKEFFDGPNFHHFLLLNNYIPVEKHAIIHNTDGMTKEIEVTQEIVKRLQDGQKIAIPCGSKIKAEKLEAYIKRQVLAEKDNVTDNLDAIQHSNTSQVKTRNIRVLCLTSTTTGEASQQLFLNNPNAEIKKYDCIIYTPCLNSGIDINIRDYVDEVWGFPCAAGSASPDGFVQALGRVRNPKTGKVHIYLPPSLPKPKPSNITQIRNMYLTGLMSELRLEKTIARYEHVARQEMLTTLPEDDGSSYPNPIEIDWKQRLWLDMKAIAVATTNRLFNNFHQSIYSLLAAEGYIVETPDKKEEAPWMDAETAKEMTRTINNEFKQEIVTRILAEKDNVTDNLDAIEHPNTRQKEAQKYATEIKHYYGEVNEDTIGTYDFGKHPHKLKRLAAALTNQEGLDRLAETQRGKLPIERKHYLTTQALFLMLMEVTNIDMATLTVKTYTPISKAKKPRKTPLKTRPVTFSAHDDSVQYFISWIIDHYESLAAHERFPTISYIKKEPIKFISMQLDKFGIKLVCSSKASLKYYASQSSLDTCKQYLTRINHPWASGQLPVITVVPSQLIETAITPTTETHAQPPPTSPSLQPSTEYIKTQEKIGSRGGQERVP